MSQCNHFFVKYLDLVRIQINVHTISCEFLQLITKLHFRYKVSQDKDITLKSQKKSIARSFSDMENNVKKMVNKYTAPPSLEQLKGNNYDKYDSYLIYIFLNIHIVYIYYTILFFPFPHIFIFVTYIFIIVLNDILSPPLPTPRLPIPSPCSALSQL